MTRPYSMPSTRSWATSSPVQAQYLAVWRTMIARFADQPGVLGFEPINEPSGGSANASTFEATTLTDFYTRMISTMQAQAPEALVFVDLTGLDGAFVATSLNRPLGSFVFAPHFYPLTQQPADVLAGLETWANLGQQWNVPVLVGSSVRPTICPAPSTS